MKKAKYLYIVFLLISFLLIPKVKADVGDLRYQITDVIITEDKITFKGWAFIHQTHNFVKLYKLNNTIETNEVFADNGGQRIIIIACANSNECTKPSIVNGNSQPNYNFTSSLYSNDGGNFYNDYGIVPSYQSGRMGCSTNNLGSNCYYRDLAFSIDFKLDDLLEIGNDFKFKIAVTNNDFIKKCNDNYSNIKNKKCQMINGEFYTKYNDLAVVNAIVNNIKNNSNDIVKITSLYEDKVKFLAETALVKKINNKLAFDGSLGPYGEIGSVFKVKKYSSESENKISNTLGTGKYILYYKETGECKVGSTNVGSYCYFGETENPDDSKVIGAWGSWVIPNGIFQISIKDKKKCPVDEGRNIGLSCNNTSNILSECKELSVTDNNGKSAVISIKQIGTIANLLSPKEIYNGGGIKFGILYYNKIQFDYVSGSRDININNVMDSRINGTEDIKLDNIKIGDISVGDIYIKKKCEQIKNDNSVETICLFHFTPQLVNEDGSIKKDGIDASHDFGINNKFYLDNLNKYDTEYRLSGSLINASFLDEGAAKKDSKDKNKAWYGSKWNEIKLSDSDDSCVVNVYGLGIGKYNKENGKKDNSSVIYNFIYRPINLNNPFPNRNAGMNWREWYSSDANKYRLEKSYSSSDYYRVELDNITVNKIKGYNKSNDYFTFDYNKFINMLEKKIEVGGNG